MTVRFDAHYYDGQTSKAHKVTINLSNHHLKLAGDSVDRFIPVDTLTLSPAVGTSKAIIYGQNNEEIHTSDLKAFDALTQSIAPNHIEHITRFLETRYQYALAALLFSIAFIAASLRWGLPAFALLVAQLLPTDLEKMMGNQTLAIMDKMMVSASELPEARQNEIRDRMKSVCTQQPCPAYTLHFRRGTAIGANAFALPAGDIIITDELIQMAETDEEILSVLFHELGHVQHRHSLRLAIQSAGAAALLVIITGDLSSSSDLIAGLPSLLMQSGYQREMEREADTHSLTMLKTACIAPKHFATMMSKLSKMDDEPNTDKSNNKWSTLLDSHPDTLSRIKAFQEEAPC